MNLVPIDENNVIKPLNLLSFSYLTIKYYRDISSDTTVAMIKSIYTNSTVEYRQDHHMNWYPISNPIQRDGDSNKGITAIKTKKIIQDIKKN